MYSNLQNPKLRKTTRNHFLQSCKDHIIFTLSNASMHGLIHVVRSKRLLLERFLWIGLVVGGFFIAAQQALHAWDRYENNPVVVTMEKDFFNWLVDFPTVLFCLRVKHKSYASLKGKYNITVTTKEWGKYLDDLLFSNYHTYSKFEGYLDGRKADLVPTNLYLELVNDATARLAGTSGQKGISRTQWPKNVEDEFTLIMTEYGVCHSFHSKLSHYFNIETFLGKGPFNSTYQNITKNYQETEVSLMQEEIVQKYLTFVTSPNDMIDISSHYFEVNTTLTPILSTSVVDIISDDAIQNLSPLQRNCKFLFDKGLKHSPVYSYNLCRSECRINLCLKYCHCIPYYYKRIDNEPICNMTGMYCLSKYPEIVSLTDPETDANLCHCLQNCNFQIATLEVESTSDWFLTPTFTLKFDSFPTQRFIRSLIFTKTDLLVQVGGLFGLFLGCSILSLIEIPYFFTLRFIWGVFGNRPIKPDI